MKNILVINLRDQIAISAMNAIIRADDTHSETLEVIPICGCDAKSTLTGSYRA